MTFSLTGDPFMKLLTRSLGSLVTLLSILCYSQTDDLYKARLMKPQIVQSWTNAVISFVVPGFSSSGVKSKTIQLAVRQAVFRSESKRPVRGPFSILMIHDPYAKKLCFIDGEHTFYVSEHAGMKGFSVLGKVMLWSGSYLELSDTNSSNTARTAFINEFDDQKLEQEWLRRDDNRIELSSVVPMFWFSDVPRPGGLTVDPKVEALEITDGVLRLDIENPRTKRSAIIWINLEAKRVIKSVVDGQDMDLSAVGKESYAVPLKRN